MDDLQDQRKAAVQRLNDKRAFTSHLVSYLVINGLLVVIWAVTGAGYFWPIWPIVGWAAGLAIHAWTLYGQRPITEDEVRKEIQRNTR